MMIHLKPYSSREETEIVSPSAEDAWWELNNEVDSPTQMEKMINKEELKHQSDSSLRK